MKTFNEEKKKNVTICLTKQTITALNELAKKENRSMSNLIEGLINMEYRKDDPMVERTKSSFNNTSGKRITDFTKSVDLAGWNANSISLTKLFENNKNILFGDFKFDTSKCNKVISLENSLKDKILTIEQVGDAFKNNKVTNSPLGYFVIVNPEGEII
jgi:hypothetical protein